MSECLQVNRAFNAIADPTRRAILEQLKSGEQPVGSVAAPHDMSLNAVSKHIKVLEAAGLVSRRRRGRTHWLSARPEGLAAAREWMATWQSFWEERLAALDAALTDDNRKDSIDG